MRRASLFVALILVLASCASQRPRPEGGGGSLNELLLAVKLAPEDVEARVRLGVAYARSGLYRQAVAEFDSALLRVPNYPLALYEKGQTLRALGLNAEGKSLIIRAVQSAQGDELLARLARELGRPFHIEQLTSGRAAHAFASWLPDGQRLVIQSHRGGDWDLYLLDLRTRALTRLTDHPARDEAPFASQDGRLLAFTSTRDSEALSHSRYQPREIYLYALETREIRRLTSTHSDDFHPVLAPQGHTLFFVSAPPHPNARRTVMALDMASLAVRPVTDPNADSFAPAVSPDGAFLLFVREEEDRSLLCEMDLRAGRTRVITDTLGVKASPSFSPDGTQIVFAAKDRGQYDLYLIARDGSNLLRLTHDEAVDGHPRFSPDGRWLVFHSDRSRTFQLYLMGLTRPPGIEQLQDLW